MGPVVLKHVLPMGMAVRTVTSVLVTHIPLGRTSRCPFHLQAPGKCVPLVGGGALCLLWCLVLQPLAGGWILSAWVKVQVPALAKKKCAAQRTA